MTDLTSELPDLSDIEAETRRLSLGVSATELHGSLCGWLAGGAALTPEWLGAVMADPAAPVPGPESSLQALATASAAQLADRSFGFDLLLPGSDTSLAVRSGALFEWCHGFVGAFGLAAGANASLSEEGEEALADLVRLAGAQVQEEGDDSDEEALVEIEEFVRVAALLLHGDCALAAQHRKRLN